MQTLVGRYPNLIESELRNALHLPAQASFNWRSPLGDDSHAEYRDADFLERLSLTHLEEKLADFWPKGGPQWDALATTANPRKVILVEAKAHIGELRSSCTATPQSRTTIESALAKAKSHYGVEAKNDWTRRYYQYANRLAHLYFLVQAGVDAHLVFVYFLNDDVMRGPKAIQKWGDALKKVYTYLGLPVGQPVPRVHNLFFDVGQF